MGGSASSEKQKHSAAPFLHEGWQRRADRGSTLIFRSGTDNAVTRVRLIPGSSSRGEEREIRRADSRMHSRRADAPLSAGSIRPFRRGTGFGGDPAALSGDGVALFFPVAVFGYFSIFYYTPPRPKSKPGKWPIRRARGGPELYKTRDGRHRPRRMGFRGTVLLTFPRKSATL